jgi:hypothetical protein
MATSDQYDARAELLRALVSKVEDDPYPSSTMLDMIESLLTAEDEPTYVETLMDKIRNDNFPSISLMKRVQNLA